MVGGDFAGRQARSIFVGNIPFDASEEKLREIIGVAGKVLSFRLVNDRDTGRSKGYGFFEFESPEMAQSALRNLSSVEYEGRPLRIGPATAGDLTANKFNFPINNRAMGMDTVSMQGGAAANMVSDQSSISTIGNQAGIPKNSLDQMSTFSSIQSNKASHFGANVNDSNNEISANQTQGLNEPNASRQTATKQLDSKDVPLEIARKMTSLPPELLQQIVQQIKVLSVNDPDQAKSILVHYPHLAYAIFHAMILTHSIKAADAFSLLRSIPDTENMKDVLAPENQLPRYPKGEFSRRQQIDQVNFSGASNNQQQVQVDFQEPHKNPNTMHGPMNEYNANASSNNNMLPQQMETNQQQMFYSQLEYQQQQMQFGQQHFDSQPGFDGPQNAMYDNKHQMLHNNNMQQHQQFGFGGINPHPHQNQSQYVGHHASPQQQNTNEDSEKDLLIRQVMMLTEEQIDLLPIEQRDSVRHLRAQVQGNNMV